MSEKTLHDAFVMELRDVLSAEKQITAALKKMIKKASHQELKAAFQEHLEQTEHQVERLEKAFGMLDLKPRSSKCEAMAGILEEGKEIMEEDATPDTLDAMMIAAAQKVEHYEIATYGTLCAWAKFLERDDIAKLLQETLDEEKETDDKLTSLAESVNAEALAT